MEAETPSHHIMMGSVIEHAIGRDTSVDLISNRHQIADRVLSRTKCNRDPFVMFSAFFLYLSTLATSDISVTLDFDPND